MTIRVVTNLMTSSGTLSTIARHLGCLVVYECVIILVDSWECPCHKVSPQPRNGPTIKTFLLLLSSCVLHQTCLPRLAFPTCSLKFPSPYAPVNPGDRYFLFLLPREIHASLFVYPSLSSLVILYFTLTILYFIHSWVITHHICLSGSWFPRSK